MLEPVKRNNLSDVLKNRIKVNKIIMEIFLEFLKDVLRGITRAFSAHLFQKIFLDKKKATPRRRKHKGGSRHK
jgi:hypothetical protein